MSSFQTETNRKKIGGKNRPILTLQYYVSFSDTSQNKYISSTCVRHRKELKDDMRWSPFTGGLWIAKLQADHAWRNITHANEIKWNEMNERSELKWWNEICGRRNRRNLEKNLPRFHFVHHETLMEWPRCKFENPAVRCRHLTACATELHSLHNINEKLYIY